MHAESGKAITIRFALPSAELAPYVTTYYLTEVVAPPSEPVLEDYLHPEWPNLRFVEAETSWFAIGDQPLIECPAFAVTGPTSRATRLRVASGRSWGIGLLPLGWASLMGAPAGDYADRAVDGHEDPVFAAFRPLATALAQSSGDFAEELAIIEAHMASLAPNASVDEMAIARINALLVDPQVSSVADMADRASMNVRSLERLCKRAFGFTPKLLLRRQRFLRSLSRFMLDPSLKWLSTLDSQYHDQAHFVRDFRRFMGMSPSAYAKLDKPLLMAAVRARTAIAGEAMQVLHDPSKSG
jgi:AraC-like DNA-binding protein